MQELSGGAQMVQGGLKKVQGGYQAYIAGAMQEVPEGFEV